MRGDDFSRIAVAARKHPPGYALHKYWARKPHNVVRRALEACGVGAGAVVLDPFCGSGVPLSEAAALGARCIGVDVNPIAVELTKAMLDPPDAEAYRRVVTGVLDDVERELAGAFEMDGRPIRYVVHATVVECPSCGAGVSADAAGRRARRYVCPSCDARLSFNLEHLVATRPLRAVLDDGRAVALNAQAPAASRAPSARAVSRFDHEFHHNARILAYRGMRTRDLFTPRNFAALTAIASRLARLPQPVRSAARLTLTASVAQCSRLVAYRNDLTTGGPAWTVPGFWVPPLHLETNPIVHMRARLQRAHKAFQHLGALPGRGPAHVVLRGDCVELLAAGLPGGERASVVFLDPPYGDSVPYLEFSALWNSFLGEAPDPALDLAVSDRSRGDGTWESYACRLGLVAGALRGALRRDGRVVVTFNNKDVRAWRALLAALQQARLRCEGAFYQHPAVVSTKAQLAQEGSYVGDVWARFARSAQRPSRDLHRVSAAVRRAVKSHPALRRDREALKRIAVLAWLRHDVDASLFEQLPELLTEAAGGDRSARSEAGWPGGRSGRP